MTGPVTWEARPFKQLPQKDTQILVLTFLLVLLLFTAVLR